MTTFSEYLLEQEILNSPMCEMANLYPRQTGVEYAMWFGEIGGQHVPRIKVSNSKNKFLTNDNFVIGLSKEPWVITPKSCKISKSELDDIFDWIKLNYDDLTKLWRRFENNGIDPIHPEDDNIHLIITSLKKL